MTATTVKAEPQIQEIQANKDVLNDDINESAESILLATSEAAWQTLVFDKFKHILEEMKTLQLNPAQNKAAIRELYTKGLMVCGTIKKLNRISNLSVNKARIRTHEEKNKIDEHHLELQNLLYEISHLKKEINTCLEFRSLHEDINLIPLTEFYAQASSEISNPEVTKKDEHKLKLAQLDWELIERQNMLNRIKDLESQIETHERQLKLKQSKLESLNPKLNQILEACKPTLNYFNTNFDENSMFSEPVQYLPKPLYHFFMMMSAYRDIKDKDIKIEVVGDLEEAKRTNINEIVNNLEEDDSDSANEDEIENEYAKKKKSKTKSNKKKNNYRDKVFNCFPLSCRVTFSVRGYGQFVLEFFYITMLKIVTMKSEIRLLKDIKFSDNSIFRSESIFDNLYENDTGLESPNMANKFLFANIGLQSIEPYTKQAGMPYKWCQYLCGLFYDNKQDRETLIFQSYQLPNDNKTVAVNNENEMDVDEEALAASENQKQTNDTKMFERIVSRLKARFKSRISLQEIINQLRNHKLPSLDHSSSKINKIQISSTVSDFKESDFEKYSSLSYTLPFVSFSFINERTCMFYELSLQKADAILHAQIVIHQDYPKIIPFFSINVTWKHQRNSTNDEAIRDMERSLNFWRDNNQLFGEEAPSNKQFKLPSGLNGPEKTLDILARQIYQLNVYFEVYIETESNYLDTNEIPVTKLVQDQVRGRDRQRPYWYLSNKNIFVQRFQQI